MQRRHLLCAAALVSCAAAPAAQAALPEFTHKVYMDIGECGEALRADRKLRDKSALCDPTPTGRMVFGLYGKNAPNTVSNFIDLLNEGAYSGTTFNKILPGRYVQAGKQGSKRYGRVDPRTTKLEPNADLVSAKAFELKHQQPGTLSWCIGANEDDSEIKQDIDFKNTEWLITTGPGPVPSLDDDNVVFGQLVEGFDVLARIVATPVIKVGGALESYNKFAEFIGDERAAKAKSKWGSPLQAVVIMDAGLL